MYLLYIPPTPTSQIVKLSKDKNLKTVWVYLRIWDLELDCQELTG